MYELREGDFDEFFLAPFVCYGSRSLYVSPLQSDLRRLLSRTDNPLFSEHGDFTFYTVRRSGRPIGRIVAHVHHSSNRRHGLQRSYFGFFDCADDQIAARTLLAAAEEWGRRHGCTEIAGNFNLTAMQQLGVMTAGFEHFPYTDQLYNPGHIPRLLTACGYDPFFPMTTFEVDLTDFDPAKLIGPKQQQILQARDLEWQRLGRRGFHELMADALSVLNDGFINNPMFVPLTQEECFFQAKDMMWIIDRRLSVLVYDEGQPVGVVVCIPDLNPLLHAARSRMTWTTPLRYLTYRLTRRRAVIIFYAVNRSFQDRGLNGAMLVRVTGALKQAGYTRLGMTWIGDTNLPSLRQAEKMGTRVLHRLHLFRKPLVEAS
ncbi:MAG: GNAT family N-acetyltransferase [Candidatus Methylomirabilales bacterium]